MAPGLLCLAAGAWARLRFYPGGPVLDALGDAVARAAPRLPARLLADAAAALATLGHDHPPLLAALEASVLRHATAAAAAARSRRRGGAAPLAPPPSPPPAAGGATPPPPPRRLALPARLTVQLLWTLSVLQRYGSPLLRPLAAAAIALPRPRRRVPLEARKRLIEAVALLRAERRCRLWRPLARRWAERRAVGAPDVLHRRAWQRLEADAGGPAPHARWRLQAEVSASLARLGLAGRWRLLPTGEPACFVPAPPGGAAAGSAPAGAVAIFARGALGSSINGRRRPLAAADVRARLLAAAGARAAPLSAERWADMAPAARDAHLRQLLAGEPREGREARSDGG